ncbi:hypothetical protein DL96DRAFT_1471061 [Flagelloscypha sp. PMI_526]|nr:hypothetical protein DL96DRAFT_1471061 [Flagelloscypha sp. PMI_526]
MSTIDIQETLADTQITIDETDPETQLQTQPVDASQPEASASTDPPPKKKKREKKEPVELVHEPGKSILPFSRVQKIIKADKEIPIVAKEATFLISLATEEFIKRITEASQRVASRENRMTVQHRDVATVVRRADEFLFLQGVHPNLFLSVEIVPWLAPSAAPKRPKPTIPSKEDGLKSSGPTLLDSFVKRGQGQGQDTQEDEDDEESSSEDEQPEASAAKASAQPIPDGDVAMEDGET